jgi:photosystem II stability/assembly factor-like uncharacterized protein
MKWLSVTLALFGLAQIALAGDTFVLVEYDDSARAYEFLDDGWAVVEAHPSFCLILCSEERAGAVPGGRIIADGSETLYVIWNPGDRPLPDIAGTRIIEVPGKAQILVARTADAMEYASAGAELKRVNKTPIRKPLDGAQLRTYDDKVPFADRYILEMIDKITPERYQEIVETLSVSITPSRYTPSTYIDAARDYIQTIFHQKGPLTVQRWYYEYDLIDERSITGMYWVGSEYGWIPTSNGYAWITVDSGENWHAYKCNGNARDIYFTTGETGFLCGEKGYIAKTDDGGLTWNPIDINDYEVKLEPVSFADSLHGITGGPGGTYYLTEDGGSTWEKSGIPWAGDVTSIHYPDNDTLWLTAGDKELYHSDDGGATWDDLSDDLPPGTFIISGVWFHDKNKGVITGTTGIYYTENGGAAWNEAGGDSVVSGDEIQFIDDKTGWTTGSTSLSRCDVYRTDDGGKSWVWQYSAISEIAGFFFLNRDVGWVVNEEGNLFHTDDGGYSWTHREDVNLFNPTWENVIGELKGTVNADEFVIVCGHYDSISEIPYKLAPGAEDNASGSGGVIAAAEAMAAYEYESTVRFITFSGEEEGLFGSTAYAEAMADKGENIVAVINMDMVAYLDEPVYDIKVKYNEPSTDLLEAIMDAGAVYTPSLEICPELYEPRGSDHIPFWENGYRAVEIIEQENDHFYPWKHSTEDLPEHLDFTYGAEVVKLAAASAAILAGITGRRPGDGEADIIAYPNPARPSDAGITFANLPDDASLALYNVAGERVFERSGIIGNEILWTLANDRGNPVASGV